MLWTLSFYAQFFDVDTSTVLNRCRAALIPFLPNTPPFLDIMDGNPDLYGPFWIATTVVVILFLAGTISHKLATEGKKHFEYDFALLGGAAGLVYGLYLVRAPGSVGRSTVVRRTVAGTGRMLGSVRLLESLLDLPSHFVSWSPLNGLNYALVGLGYGVSVFFLGQEFVPCDQRYREEDQSGFVDCGCRGACWPGDCDQDSVLQSQKSRGGETLTLG